MLEVSLRMDFASSLIRSRLESEQQKDPLRGELWPWINTLQSRKMKLDAVISMDHLIRRAVVAHLLKCWWLLAVDCWLGSNDTINLRAQRLIVNRSCQFLWRRKWKCRT